MKNYKCAVCDKVYQTKRGLVMHKRIHNTGENYGKTSELNPQQKLNHSGKTFACKICDSGFSSRTSLTRHLSTHLEVRKFKCDVCKNMFSSKHELLEHNSSHNPQNGEINSALDVLVAPLSNSTLNEPVAPAVRATLKMRSSGHSPLETVKCETCGEKFSVNEIKKHLQSHDGEKFECEVCGKRFFEKRILSLHMTFHDDIKKFDCKVCGKQFYEKRKLSLHMKLHDDIKRFKCDTCHKRFKRRCDLSRHISFHKVNGKHEETNQSAGQHVCKMCGKSYGTGNVTKDLKRNGKNKCDACRGKYLDNSSLMRSMCSLQMASKEWKHICEICGTLFESQSEYIGHLKIFTHKYTCGRYKLRNAGTDKSRSVSNAWIWRYLCDICGIFYRSKSEYLGQLVLSRSLCYNYHGTGNRPLSATKPRPREPPSVVYWFEPQALATSHIMVATSGSQNSHPSPLKARAHSIERKPQILTDEHTCSSCRQIEGMENLKSTMPSGRRMHLCDICGALLGYESAFNKHLESHMNSYRLHYEKQHAETEIPKIDEISEYICESCGVIYKYENALIRHMNTHTNIYACRCCGKRHEGPEGLESHVKICSGAPVVQAVAHSEPDRPSGIRKEYRIPVVPIPTIDHTYCKTDSSARTNFSKKTLVAIKNETRVKPGNEADYRCACCQITYKNKQELVRHLKCGGRFMVPASDLTLSFPDTEHLTQNPCRYDNNPSIKALVPNSAQFSVQIDFENPDSDDVTKPGHPSEIKKVEDPRFGKLPSILIEVFEKYADLATMFQRYGFSGLNPPNLGDKPKQTVKPFIGPRKEIGRPRKSDETENYLKQDEKPRRKKRRRLRKSGKKQSSLPKSKNAPRLPGDFEIDSPKARMFDHPKHPTPPFLLHDMAKKLLGLAHKSDIVSQSSFPNTENDSTPSTSRLQEAAQVLVQIENECPAITNSKQINTADSPKISQVFEDPPSLLSMLSLRGLQSKNLLRQTHRKFDGEQPLKNRQRPNKFNENLLPTQKYLKPDAKLPRKTAGRPGKCHGKMQQTQKYLKPDGKLPRKRRGRPPKSPENLLQTQERSKPDENLQKVEGWRIRSDEKPPRRKRGRPRKSNGKQQQTQDVKLPVPQKKRRMLQNYDGTLEQTAKYLKPGGKLPQRGTRHRRKDKCLRNLMKS